MTKRMLIDSTHAEETRVVVLDGSRLEDYDVETSTKQQLKGNIYLAKVVRVEPSLQAAFVEYGGGRHGFLAFGEIHPDYYQIPVSDRQRLMEMQEAEAREEEEAEDRAAAREARGGRQPGRGGSPASDDAAAPDMAAVEAAYDTQASDSHAGADDDAGSAAAEAGADGDEPVPRPSQVAQAAAITQDILVAPEDAEAMFPASDDGADMAPEGAEPAPAQPPAVNPSQAPEAEPPQASETNQPDAPDDGSRQDGGIEGAPDADSPSVTPDPVDSPPAEVPADPLQLEEMPSGAGLTEAAGAPVDAYANGHDTGSSDDAAPADAGDAGLSLQEEADYAGPAEPPPEPAGAADGDEPREARATPRFLRNYKIQEVIRRRQILLIQVVKEERGTKGAALTTYISLAGRFSVLMPNSPRGGRDQPQDHVCSGPPPVEGGHVRAGSAARHGADRPHGGGAASEGGDIARLRVPAGPVGPNPRADHEEHGARADL